jgi:hypothetical protein
MAITIPKLIPGWIYCIREEDYLDGSIGRYVKLGLTKRTVADRIREHQTGNPRKEVSEYDHHMELMHYAENFLHHYFAYNRIAGEWFDMDSNSVLTKVKPLLERMEIEQASSKPNIERWVELKELTSNGVIRPANAADQALHDQYKKADEKLTLASAQHAIHDYNIRAMIGSAEGIEKVVTLILKTYNDVCDTVALKATLSPREISQCEETTTKIIGSLIITGGRKLNKLDEVLAASLEQAKNSIGSKPTSTNLGNLTKPLVKDIKDEHIEWIRTLRGKKEAEWNCLQLGAQLVVALDEDEQIEGIIKWKRQNKTTTSFKPALAKELFETRYNASLQPKDDSVDVKIHEGRTYLP